MTPIAPGAVGYDGAMRKVEPDITYDDGDDTDIEEDQSIPDEDEDE